MWLRTPESSKLLPRHVSLPAGKFKPNSGWSAPNVAWDSHRSLWELVPKSHGAFSSLRPLKKKSVNSQFQGQCLGAGHRFQFTFRHLIPPAATVTKHQSLGTRPTCCTVLDSWPLHTRQQFYSGDTHFLRHPQVLQDLLAPQK